MDSGGTLMWKYFILGLLAGWLIEWVIDWLYWRRSPASDSPAAAGSTGAVASVPAAAPSEAVHAPGRDSLQGAAQSSLQAAVPDAAAAGGAAEPKAGMSEAGTSAHAATAAADEGAIGAAGAAASARATIIIEVPVYRQEDLEAIDGIGPKIGAMLRNNGITTFGELAALSLTELVRIVESTGEDPAGAGIDDWVEQARLAAAQNWTGLAELQSELRRAGARGEV
jgi:predicted flap endonuclease-1-like 5' DNA nuclease